MKKILVMGAGLVAGVFMVMSSTASASSSKCQGLKEELQAMRRAQSQIIQSLVNNHESFAISMEEYSANVTKAPITVSKQMNKSAQAFRLRGVQGKQIAEKFNQTTNELLEKVATCM